MNREKRLVKNSFILLIGQVFPKLTFLVTLPILTGYLTKAEYGTYDLISVLQALLIPILTLQIQVASFRYLIEKKDVKEEKSKIITNVFLFIIPDALILFFTVFLILLNYSVLIRLFISLFLSLEMIYDVLGQVTRGLLDTKKYSIAGILYSFLNMVFVILLLYIFDLGLLGLLVCMIISVIIPSAYLFFSKKIYTYINLKLKDKKVIKQLLNYSWPMIPLAISMWVINASDRLVITVFLGIEANAVYAVARKIPNIINLIQASFHTAWTESAALAEKDSDSSDYYSKMFDKLFKLLAGITMLVAAFTPILFSILIKGNYNDAYYQMPILLFSMIFYTLSSFIGGLYTAKKKTKNVGLTTILAAFINIIVDLILIKYIGLYAASISTLVSYIALTIFRMINICNFIDIKYDIKQIIIILFLVFISCGLLYIDSFIVISINIVISFIFSIIINIELISMIIKTIKKRLLNN